MTDSTQNIAAESISEVKRGRFIHALVNRDTTPLVILIMAAVVGAVTGLLGVAFDRGVDGSSKRDWQPWLKLLIVRF